MPTPEEMFPRSLLSITKEREKIEALDVEIDYTNHRLERRWRRIRPIKMTWGLSEWHVGNQWILLAHCYEKNCAREFAMTGVHGWRSI